MLDKFVKILQSFSRVERLILGAAVSIFLLAGFFISASFIAQKTIEAPVSGGQYREGAVGQPTFVNPVLVGGSDVDRDLVQILFSNLVSLADSYKLDNNGKTWDIRLKDNIFWHDGQPITSDDIIFTIETIQNPDTRSHLFPAWQGVMAQRISERELKLALGAPYSFFEKNLEELRPIPKHIFGSIPAANLRLSNYNLEPIGSGPFKFSSFEKRKDGFVTDYYLARYKNYFGDKPYLDKIIFKFYENKDGLMEAFNNGLVDGFGDVDPKELSQININHRVFDLRVPRYYGIFFNPYANPLLGDKNLRLALNFAVDKSVIVDRVFNRHALTVSGPLLPGMDGYAAKVYPLDDFSIDKAKAILDANGWETGGDTVRMKNIPAPKTEGAVKSPLPSVSRLEFTLVVPQTEFLVEAANIIAEDWSKIGVKLNLNIVSPDDIDNQVIKTRNYEMILFGNIFGNNPDPFSFWDSSERFYPGLNLALYQNKTADYLIEAVRKDLNDQSRNSKFASLQSVIIADLPAIFLFSPYYLYVSRSWLGGFDAKFIPFTSSRFQTIEKWYVKTARVFR